MVDFYRPDLAIIGAGLAGLTCALALQRAGLRPVIFEQSPVLGEVGAGIMLTPNASIVLHHLGLLDALQGGSIEPENNYLHDHVDDGIISNSDLGMKAFREAGNPFRTIHRSDLHSLLCAAVLANDAGCIRVDHGLVDIVDEGSSVALGFANGASAKAGIVIGSDGIRSIVRRKLFDETQPEFTGNVAWRGVVDNRDASYRMDAGDMGNWIGPERNVVVYPLRGGRELNYVAISRRDSWVAEGWNVRSTPAELVAEFSGWSPRILAMFAATPADRCFKWGLFDREPMIEIARGRVALLGDAAHPMLPFLAQGSAMGIEDAITMSRCLAIFNDPIFAFKAYETARRDRTGWVQLQARQARKLFHAKIGSQTLSDRVARSERLYNYNAVTVTIPTIVDAADMSKAARSAVEPEA
jgi:salicylate hydroxylase